MVVLGMWVRSNYYQIPSNHYSLIPEGTHYTVRIERVLKPNTYAFRYYGTIVQVNQSPSQGKILLIQKKEDGQLPLSVGHFILTKEIPFSIAAPKNPGAFDYAAYLKNLRIRDQIELSPQEYVCLTKQPAYGSDWLHQVKSNAIKRIQSSPLSSHAAAHWLALVFGEQQFLEAEVREAYSQAGVIHLLAISGLHIGILSFVISGLFRPLLWWRYGQWIQQLLRVIILWGFAFWTGLQPAVVRAVTFFSLLDIGHWGRRPQPAFHRMVLSAFILLWAYPPFLNQLGFQLSYLAVFGIFIAHAFAKTIYHPKRKWKKRLWNFSVVCIGAQLGVAPLIVYHFNQLPVLFLVSNLLIFHLFIFSLLLALILTPVILLDTLPAFILELYNRLVALLYGIVTAIAGVEKGFFDSLSLRPKEVIFFYALFFAACYGWQYRQKYQWKPLLVTLSCCLLLTVYEIVRQPQSPTLWVLHTYQKTTLVYYDRKEALVYSDLEKKRLSQLLLSFQREYPINQIKYDSLWRWLDLGEKKVLLMDFQDPISDSFPRADILLLRKNPKIHMSRIINQWNPTLVIADGSNGPWDFERWEKSCTNAQVKFKTTRDGAIAISL